MAAAQPIGIDLGTTYSAVAHLDGTGRTAMVRNAETEILTPSVVLFDGEEIIVGTEARKAVGIELGKTAECAKRDIGNPSYSRTVNGQNLPPEVIEAYILRKLKQDTTAVLGEDLKAVITVPAFFDEARRKATADAGEMAGIDVLDIVNEPTAAALAYGEKLGYLNETGAPSEPMKVLVYDLGGGTFDVTVLDLRPGDLRTLATDGDTYLGGYDWDRQLADHAAQLFKGQYGDDPRHSEASLARLMRSAEEAKHTLSSRARATIHVQHQGRSLDVAVTQREFADLTAHLLERTSFTTGNVVAAAGLKWSDISRVLLVGGSTRMPMVRELLQRISGIEPDASVYPDEAVARGAALYARYLMESEGPTPPSFTVAEVNAHSLGILGVDQATGRKENVTVIARNTPLPARVVRNFVTREANQRSIVIQVLEGESTDPGHCTVIGKAVLRNLPPNLRQGWPVQVRYQYGRNGRLSVRAVVPGTEREVLMELEHEHGLADDHLQHWKQVLLADVGARPSGAARFVAPVGGAAATGRAAEPHANHQTAARGDADPTADEHHPAADTGDLAIPIASDGDHDDAYGDHAAEQDAAEQRRPRRRRSGKLGVVITIGGHVLASLIGLAVGYLVLCSISPRYNFLKLNIPGVTSPTADETKSDQPE